VFAPVMRANLLIAPWADIPLFHGYCRVVFLRCTVSNIDDGLTVHEECDRARYINSMRDYASHQMTR
jgi:hypothetical protein